MMNNYPDGVDDVFINLGINDVNACDDSETLKCYEYMLQSIKEYNDQINVFIGLCILPADYEYGNGNTSTQMNKYKRLELIQKLIDKYDQRENENIYLVPYYLSIDTENDWDVEEKSVSDRNSELVPYLVDEYSTHPGKIGQDKIADMSYTYIKYAE